MMAIVAYALAEAFALLRIAGLLYTLCWKDDTPAKRGVSIVLLVLYAFAFWGLVVRQ